MHFAMLFGLTCLTVALGAQATPPATKPTPQQQAPAATPPAPGAKPQDDTVVTAERLEQLVAPIALYPDALLSQVLMASSYPIEIVEAARWSQKNPKLTGDKLEAALKDQDWDPSVKSLCGLPEVLKRMNENLDWTQDLGDAFLSQKARLMDAVQTMRRKAYEAGSLKSGEQLKVTEQEDKIIVIESTKTEVVYVPTYYPTAVYGSWSYPVYYYPPMYPPAPAGGMFLSFTAGMVWGAAIWGGCNWGWGHGDVTIDIDRHNNFVQNTDRDSTRNKIDNKAGAKDSWKHDPQHRKGAGYKDNKVAQRYGAESGSGRVTRDQARGYADRSGKGPSAATRDVGGARPTTQRPSGGAGAKPTARAAPATRTGQSSGSFSGARNPGLDRASSTRGSASRGSSGARSGGGARGGGGRGR
jgi:hypothetical protein